MGRSVQLQWSASPVRGQHSGSVRVSVGLYEWATVSSHVLSVVVLARTAACCFTLSTAVSGSQRTRTPAPATTATPHASTGLRSRSQIRPLSLSHGQRNDCPPRWTATSTLTYACIAIPTLCLHPSVLPPLPPLSEHPHPTSRRLFHRRPPSQLSPYADIPR